MLDINHILVALDPEHTEQIALQKAIWLAKQVGADIRLLTSVYEPYAANYSALDAETQLRLKAARIDSSKAWLADYAKDIEDQSISVQTQVIWCSRLDEAVMISLTEKDYDLVIKGTDHHSLIDKLFPHCDWNILRHCPAPVLLVKSPKPWASNRILASIDATTLDETHRLINENILDYAEHLADHLSTDLHLVNAVPQLALALAMIPEAPIPSDIQPSLMEEHRAACKQYAHKYSLEAEQLHIEEGETDQVVAKVVEDIQADLLLIGSVGRSGLSGLLLGNSSETLVDQVPCDLLIIKEGDGVAEPIQ